MTAERGLGKMLRGRCRLGRERDVFEDRH